MTEQEMLDCLQCVWENMTSDKDRQAYRKILLLLDNMAYYLRYDLQCEYTLPKPETKRGKFDF